jgi:hypothetical protein
MSWLRKTAQLVEVIVTNPGATRSGTCALCESLEGEPVEETGPPPFHQNCACGVQVIESERQPGPLLEDEFTMEPAESVEEEREPGLVIPL